MKFAIQETSNSVRITLSRGNRSNSPPVIMYSSHCIRGPEDPKELAAEVKTIAPLGLEFAFDAVGTRPERLQELMALTELGTLAVAVGVLGFSEVVPMLGGDLLFCARRLAGVRGGNAHPGLDIPRILELHSDGPAQA
jgi:Zn-dependent alcohol dehydrogenase